MKLRMILSVLICLALGGVAANAQESIPKIEGFVGFSHLNVSPQSSGLGSFGTNGANAQVTLNFTKWISGVADIAVNSTGYRNSNTVGLSIHGTISSYLFGPRVVYRHFGKVTPYAEALVGAAYANPGVFDSFTLQNALMYGGGGGVDIKLSKHWGVRPIAVDYLRSRFSEESNGQQTQSYLRFTTGLTVHF